jgi:hypothetical protein
MTLPATATLREFAGFVPCRPSYVTELKKTGRLVFTEDGKRVRVVESLRLIEETKDPSKRGVAARHAASRAPAAPAVANEDESAGDELDAPPPQSSEFQKSRAEREKWAAKSAQLDYERSIGKLLDAEQVEASAASAVIVLRTNLEAMPSELAPLLAAMTDEARVRSALAERIEHALQECARQFSQLAKGTT